MAGGAQHKILYLPIETTARELDAKLLLAHRALAHGYTVVIGRKKFTRRIAERIGHGIYFFKDNDRSGRGFPRARSFYKVSLDEEGLVLRNDKEFITQTFTPNIHTLDLVLTWGTHQQQVIEKECPHHSFSLVASGNPRIDLLRPEYGILYDTAGNDLKKKYGVYVLVNTNFGAGNLSRHYRSTYIQQVERSGRIKSEEDTRFYEGLQEYYRMLFAEYKRALEELSEEFPQLTFILRPHPSEDHKNWKDALAGHENITVIHEGSVIDWIYASIAVIHTGCTTGIEAWAMRKPVFRYNPDPVEKFESRLPNMFGYDCRTLEKLKEHITQAAKGEIEGTFEEQKHIAKPWAENIDGDLAVNTIVQELHKAPREHAEVLCNANAIKRIDSLSERFRWEVSRWFTVHAPYVKPATMAEFQKFPWIKKEYIVERFERFDSIHGKKLSLNTVIKKIAIDTYLITAT